MEMPSPTQADQAERQQSVAGTRICGRAPMALRPALGPAGTEFLTEIGSDYWAVDTRTHLGASQGTSQPTRSHKSMAAVNRLWRVAAA
jgi:hypothetical protein